MAQQQEQPAPQGFLDQIKAEWQLMADSIVVEAPMLADEASSDFQGHAAKTAERHANLEKQQSSHRPGFGMNNTFVKPFISGVYSVRNVNRAQGHGPAHGGRSCGSEFANFGCQMGPMMGGPEFM